MNFRKANWIILRLALGFIFLWAFADKLLGLGFNTAKGNAMIGGGSPTAGFLTNSVRGPFADFFNSLLAYNPYIDWLFMAGLLAVGLSLIVNKFVLWSAVFGSLMLLLMYLAAFPPTANPFIDSHIIYILALGLIAARSRDRAH